MLKFRNVYKTYPGPTHALRNVSFEIQAGEFVFLTGPSGAGKTTLFKLLIGLEAPSSGEVFCQEFKLSQLDNKTKPLYRQNIGVVFQDFKLLNSRTVLENMALPLLIRGEDSQLVQKKVQGALEAVGLSDKGSLYPLMLSGGEQQRVAIARALIHKPALVIADEPTGNLDPKLSKEIFDLFEYLCAHGTSVILATHDIQAVEQRKKRTLTLKAGSLFEKSAHGNVELYL